jgi:hypothetical protein
MSDAEAKEALPPAELGERVHIVKVADPKANYAARASETRWLRKHAERLPNGDEAPCLKLWAPPLPPTVGTWELRDVFLQWLRDETAAGRRYKMSDNGRPAETRLIHQMVSRFEVSAENAKKLRDEMVRAGLLVEEHVGKPSEATRFAAVAGESGKRLPRQPRGSHAR